MIFIEYVLKDWKKGIHISNLKKVGVKKEMKAKEYFAKFGKAVYEEAIAWSESKEEDTGEQSALRDLFFAFTKECRDILASRHTKKDEAVYAVIREQNQKWNVLCRLFKEEYGQDILKENAVLDFFVEKIPELRIVMERSKAKKLGVRV